MQGAVRILHGQLPYRDFFSFYTPGSYYWYAILLKIFGDSILVPRTVLVAYGALFSLLTYILARRLARRTGAILVTLLLLVCCLPLRFLIIHNWDSTVAALLALYCAVLFLEAPGKWRAVLVGLFTALAILFNQARGGGLLLGLLLGFLLLRVRLQRQEISGRNLMWMGIGLVSPLALTAAYFALHHGVAPMATSVLWPLRHYTRANHLPYGYITTSIHEWNALLTSPWSQRWVYYFIFSIIFIICAFPVFVVLAAALSLFARRPDLPREQLSLLTLGAAVVLGSLLSVEATRPDFHHITFLAPLFFFLLPWIYGAWRASFPSLRKAAPVVLIYLLIGFAGYGLTLRKAVAACTHVLHTRRGTVFAREASETIPLIQANFPPGSRLLVHPYLPLYLYLTRTESPLSYDYFQPGMHTPEQFQEAVHQLAQSKLPAVFLQWNFPLKIPGAWPNTPSSALKDPVTDYIVVNYRLCRLLDANTQTGFLFMVRKDLDCSQWQNSN